MSEQHFVSIASQDAVARRVRELSRRDDSTKARIAHILKRLWDPKREIRIGPEAAVFDDLQARFPNFTPVIDYWRNVALVSRKLDAPFLPQPVLLGGMPGLGKTVFSSASAKAMQLHFAELSMVTVTAAFVMSGGSMQWSEGSPGFIARTLSESDVANPMLLIDEVDKAMHGNYNPMGPLYPLLERHSAKRFRDEALELELDASHIIWVATANEVNNIPDPILSRMRYFEIRKPTPTEMKAIVRNIYHMIRTTEDIGRLLAEDIPEETVKALAHMLPREARKHLQEACLRAFGKERSTVLPEDIVAENIPPESRIGFL